MDRQLTFQIVGPFPVTKKIGASSYELRIFILYFVYDRSKYLVTGFRNNIFYFVHIWSPRDPGWCM